MISHEPIIKIGLLENRMEVAGELKGGFSLNDSVAVDGDFQASLGTKGIDFSAGKGLKLRDQTEITLKSDRQSKFILRNVTIGIQFHWERSEDETFLGDLQIIRQADGKLTAINEIGVEEYLKSVVSSEMSATAPLELLKAHSITSRSWLVAMLEREQRNVGVPSRRSHESKDEIIRWYDREDHKYFDVCADDHCQRYQGVTKIISQAADDAVEATRGMFLVYNEEICDSRFSKACGGISEDFETAWEDKHIPYLTAISDSRTGHKHVRGEEEASQWIMGSPEAYCNTSDGKILQNVLPSFDQETTDFFRWKVEYKREDLEDLLKLKSGIDFGVLQDLQPLARGPSGRIFKLRIEGSKRSLVIGKELEIRRWLSKSHLFSSAFVPEIGRDTQGTPVRIVLHGAGWGHGVGLCQIGAAVMATQGFNAEQIVKHYFRGAVLKKLY